MKPRVRSRGGVLAAVASSLALCAPAAAAAAPPRTAKVCAPSAGLYESPRGARVGVVHKDDRVKVVRVGADDAWWRVAADFGTRGWIREAALCGQGR